MKETIGPPPTTGDEGQTQSESSPPQVVTDPSKSSFQPNVYGEDLPGYEDSDRLPPEEG